MEEDIVLNDQEIKDFYGDMPYSVEREVTQQDTIQEMVAQGYDPNALELDYPVYAASKQPTFLSEPGTNPQLDRMMLAKEFIVNPEVREQPEFQGAMDDYLKLRTRIAAKRSLVGKMATGLINLGEKIASPVQDEDADFLYSDLNQDTKKAMDWMDDLVKVHEPKNYSRLQGYDIGVEVLGFVGDTIAIGKAVNTATASLGKAVTAGNAAKAEGVINRFIAGRLLKTSAAGGKIPGLSVLNVGAQLLEDVQYGVAFAARDLIVNEDIVNMEFKDQIDELGTAFGHGFAIDFGLNAVSNLALPFVKNMGRIFFQPGAGNVVQSLKNVNYETLTGLATQALKGDLTKDTLKRYKQLGHTELVTKLEALQTNIRTINNLQETGKEADAMAKFIAQSNNMDISAVPGGYDVILNTTAKKLKTKSVATLDQAFKLVDDQMVKSLDRPQIRQDEIASINKDLKITQEFSGRLKSEKASFTLDEFSEAVLPRQGSFNARNKNEALRYVKTALTELDDVAVEGLEKLSVKLSDDFYKRTPSITSDVLEVPRSIKSAAEQKQYLKYVSGFVENHGTNINKGELDQLFKTLGDTTGTWSLRDMDWISSRAKTEGLNLRKTKEGYLINEDNREIFFKDQEQLGNYVYSKTITQPEYVEYLKKERNYTLAKDPDTELLSVLNPAHGKVATGESLEQIMSENPMLRPKYPLRTGPKLVFISDNIREVRFDGQFVQGSATQIKKYLENYKDFRQLGDILNWKATKKIPGTEVMVDTLGQRWRVESPSTGMTPKYFKTEKSLNKYLSSIDTPEKKLLQHSQEKGYQLLANQNGFVLQKAGEADQFFHTFDDTMNYIKNAPAPIRTSEIFEGAETSIQYGKELFANDYKNVDFDNNPKLSSGMATLKTLSEQTNELRFKKKRSPLMEGAANMFSGFRASRGNIHSIVKKNKDFQPLAKHFSDLVETEKIMKSSQDLFHRAIQGFDNLVKKDRRVQLGNLLSKELSPDLWDSAFTKMTGENLTSSDTKFLTSVRKIFDDAASLNGFTDSLDRIENYFPRFKTLDLEDIVKEDANPLSLAKKAFGRELNPAEKKFFENLRTSDIVSYMTIEDPLVLLQKYADDSLRARVLNPAVDRLMDFAENAALSENDLSTVRKIGQQARGLNDSLFVENLKRFNDDFNITYKAKIAGVDKKVMREGLSPEIIANMPVQTKAKLLKSLSTYKFRQNPINQLMGMVTLSTQSFKPWLPLRNTFQPETHLAPIFGFDAVARAKKTVSEMPASGWQYLARTSILQSKTPQDILGLTGSGWLNKLNETGLSAYKASDDFDRAVGFFVVKDSLENGMEVMKNHGLANGAEWFMQNTKLYAAPKHIQDDVIDLMSQGLMERATHTYAQWMNSMTFLDYSAITKPSVTNSFVGKIFGQMGTFSSQTLESRKYFMENLSKRDKASYALTAIGGAYALNSTFSALTQSEVNNFSVWDSMIFTGGPLMQTLYNGTQAIGGSEYKKAQAKSALLRDIPSLLLPINTTVNVAQGIGRAVEGNIIGGVQQALNVPNKGRAFE